MGGAKRLFSGINLSCRRGGALLFQNLAFGLNPGSVLHLTGPNGVGKTSLLRMMAGVLPSAAGHITWQGANFLENGIATHAERLSFLPADDRNLKPLETALENMQFWARFWGAAEKNCGPALGKMDIGHLKHTPVRHLSAGQKRRLSLARVFIKKAPLWLLDEPLNGLDRSSYDLFVQALNEHCAIGGMAVIASHYAVEPPKYGSMQRLELGAG